MRIAIVNKSDTRGGAAIVSRRLMHALRHEGVDARMLVAERLSDDPYVVSAATPLRTKIPFLLERMEVFAANGFDRSTLFKVDPASEGLPLWRHPIIREADAVILNWINQGMLSLDGIARIAAEKPVIWTMHDMWCATGICHHAGNCLGFETECGFCPLLGKKASGRDMSFKVHRKKKTLYSGSHIHFVAVSNWLKDKCRQSSLMRHADISVIPNPFHLGEMIPESAKGSDGVVRAVMAAARLDDDVKGFPILIKALNKLSERHKDFAAHLHIILCGDIRDRALLQQIPVSWEWKGNLPAEKMPEVYTSANIVLSPSRYETLPGTLVEAQAYGALPVAFDRGGQRDIIDHGKTGIIAPFGSDDDEAANNFAEALREAVHTVQTLDNQDIIHRLYSNVRNRFSASSVAHHYIDLIKRLESERRDGY